MECRTNAHREHGRGEGMAAKIEEIIVNIHRFPMQHFAPDRGQFFPDGAARQRGIGVTSRREITGAGRAR